MKRLVSVTADVFALAGGGCVAYGAWLQSKAAGLVFGGLVLFGIGYLLARSVDRDALTA